MSSSLGRTGAHVDEIAFMNHFGLLSMRPEASAGSP
jgi:hypothetical protein